MAQPTPWEQYQDAQKYIQEFNQKTINVIEVFTEAQVAGELPGLQLFPQAAGGVRVSENKIGKQERRSITARLKVASLAIKHKFTLRFMYLSDLEMNRLKDEIFKTEEVLYLRFIDDDHLPQIPLTGPLDSSTPNPLFNNKIPVKMTNDIEKDIRPITTQIKGGEISAMGDKSWKGMTIYQGIIVTLKEI